MVDNTRQHPGFIESDKPFDVIVVGGGINGAAIFSRLARDGYRTLLIDKGDFGSATSQESAMMIWGGLLYLTRLDFRTVYTLSRNRDQLLEQFPKTVHPQYFRYLALRSGWHARPLVKWVTEFYRLMGGLRRRPSIIENQFAESDLVRMDRYRGSVAYEEAMITTSDTRFVLDLIRAHDSSKSIPLNYVSLEEGEYDHARRVWWLGLVDQFGGKEFKVSARIVINATGPFVDEINRRFNVVSPYRHVFSKGVFLAFERPTGHNSPLVFELEQHRDVHAFIPWGPVSCWGPTETAIHDLGEANEPVDEDIRFLLEQANRSLNYPLKAENIVSYRCGVRPLAVDARYHFDRYPLELSRHYRVHVSKAQPWLSVYGGKFTSSFHMAGRISAYLEKRLGRPAIEPSAVLSSHVLPEEAEYPGLDGKFPSIAYCVENEYCLTIDDYLRRRTNIAQWVPRNGLGRNNEHLPVIKRLAEQLPRGAGKHHLNTVERYVSETNRIHDRITRCSVVTENE